MKEYLGAIDQGTTSTRFIVFDKHGTEITSHQKEHAQIMPQKGYVEHDPTEIWKNTVEVIETAMKNAELKAEDIVGVGITNQRETTVVWNKETGEPLYNAVVWMDMRSQGICNAKQKILSNSDDPERATKFRNKTGLPIVPYFSATKIKWLIDNVPDVSQAVDKGVACFGTIDSWLMYKLSGNEVHLTDVTNASRTLLMNINDLAWDDELLSFWDIKKECLPQIVSSCDVFFQIKGN